MTSIRRVGAFLAALLVACALSACAPDSGHESARHALVRVPEDAATLTEAAKMVAPGGTIQIGAGTYREPLFITTPDVTVRGADRNKTVIDGEGFRPYGIVATADGVRVENLTVTGATFYGVLFTGLHDKDGPSAPTATGYKKWDPAKFPPLQRFLVDHVTAYNNGLYGIYSFNSQHGIIRNSYASGSADSGIYVGQCKECNILVTGNVAERSAVGFENANASDSVVIVANRFSHNRIGMTLLSSYQEAFTPQRGNQVAGNLISSNDEAQSPAQADGAFATGIGISGGQDNVFTRNRVTSNARAGIIFSNTEDIPAISNRFTDTVFTGNGVDVANVSAARAAAVGNCVSGASTSLPAPLASEVSGECAGKTRAQSSGTLPAISVPAGLSFKRVPAPRDQPNLAPPATSERLPKTIVMPDLASVAVPADSFLNERTGTR